MNVVFTDWLAPRHNGPVEKPIKIQNFGFLRYSDLKADNLKTLVYSQKSAGSCVFSRPRNPRLTQLRQAQDLT
ncbi:hypothetical protein P872_19180 [Rhodonellum psychrophilum GCM71 = DSM 17998]|uniref:Uncharacterized protein n=1 Tax=Rhodonellum psychrophilum GCM71 = DSM 17998 TaxID=1123057 RepID=U5BW38_9BACT|nr:hypothetical protein P872_19180 [Rhodonellum psychrophilum GCM71 = DSM 17998]